MKLNKISLILCAVCPAASLAETATLPDIKVYSAYATPVNQDKTASSVTVLTEKDFTERNATYVSDVLKTVPSVAFGISGGRGAATSLFLRGADSNHTAVFIDGVRVNPIGGDAFDFGGLTLSNIERIEVLRGEQSALWGSDAMGGVIYITTKSGLYKEKPFNLDFDIGTGSHGTVDGSATISGYNKGFYYSVHGDSHRTRGISALSKDTFSYTAEDGTNFTKGGWNENDRFHRDNVSARFGYDDGNKGLEFLTSHSTQTYHYDDDTLGRTETQYDDRTRTRSTLFKLGGYWGSDKDLFKHKLGVSHLKTDIDNFYLSQNYTTFTFDPAWSANDGKRLNTNYQLDVNFDREGYVKQGFSFLTDYQKSDYTSTNFNGVDKKLIEKGVAAEYRLFTEDDHNLSISGRYTDNSQYENVWTGRISGAYRLSSNIKAHASLGTAYQNPTMIEYYGYSATYIGNPNVKPEKSKGGDIGLLLETTDKRHSLDTTYFARNVENFISSEKVRIDSSSVYRATNLDGTTKIKGVEVAYHGKFTDALTGYANYTYTQTKDSKDLELLRRPKHMANVGVAYQITEQLGSDVNASYVGKRIDNYYDAFWLTHRTKLPSYTLVNLGINYQLTNNLNVYANLNNLFDKKYENILGYGQDGRNVYVGLKGSF